MHQHCSLAHPFHPPHTTTHTTNTKHNQPRHPHLLLPHQLPRPPLLPPPPLALLRLTLTLIPKVCCTLLVSCHGSRPTCVLPLARLCCSWPLCSTHAST